MSWNAGLPADSSLIRLSAGYIRNNEAATQNVLTPTNLTNNIPYIPTAAPMYFYLDTAAVPSGWFLYSSVSDCLLAIKGGTSQYNVTGGTGVVQGTWLGPAVNLTLANMSTSTVLFPPGNGSASITAFSNPFVQGTKHEHDWTVTRPSAAVGCLATKNA